MVIIFHSHSITFYCIFDQINEALVNIKRDVFQNLWCFANSRSFASQ